MIEKLFEGVEVEILDIGNSVCFICPKVKLDAVYNKETKKITGKGSKACKDFIYKTITKIKRG